jgi:hypothetical protein
MQISRRNRVAGLRFAKEKTEQNKDIFDDLVQYTISVPVSSAGALH